MNNYVNRIIRCEDFRSENISINFVLQIKVPVAAPGVIRESYRIRSSATVVGLEDDQPVLGRCVICEKLCSVGSNR